MKKILILFGVIIMAALVLTGCGKPKQITKDQMIEAQINFSRSIAPIESDMANSYSQYIAYNESNDKFKSDIASYLKRYNDIEKSYTEFNKKYTLDDVSSKDANLKKAVGDIETARNSIKTILQGTIKNGKIVSRDEMLDLYLKQSKIMQTNLSEFKKLAGLN